MNKQKAYEELKAWFDSNRDMKEAQKLHAKYSKNYANKMRLAKNIPLRKKLLPTYLMELLNKFKPADSEKLYLKKAVAPSAPTRKEDITLKLAKEFPKLVFKDLPDNLKLLVFKRYDAWEQSKKQHVLLHTSETDDDRFTAVRSCVLAIKENWTIWDELNEYHKTGKVLGLHSSMKENNFDIQIKKLEELSPEEYTKQFMTIRKNMRNNINALVKKYNGEVPETSLETLNFNIYKFNVVSKKLKEPEWKEAN